jgi:hypothetical protein
MLSAVAMHPDDRPANMAELRSALFSEPPPAMPASGMAAFGPLGRLVSDNRAWFIAAGVAMLIGLLVTLAN